MKSIRYKSRALQIIWTIIMIFGFQINFLAAANTNENHRLKSYSICVICSNDVSAAQKDELFNELILLAPSAPAEATFSDETVSSEINLIPTTPAEATFSDDAVSPGINLIPTTPAEASFDDDPQFITTGIFESLAATPQK
jgi:hypothetical protein